MHDPYNNPDPYNNLAPVMLVNSTLIKKYWPDSNMDPLLSNMKKPIMNYNL